MVTDDNFPNILLDVAVLRSLNIRVVICHGAAAQIKALAEEQNVKTSDLDGSGITDAGTLKLALTTYLLALAVFIPVSGWVADRLAPDCASARRSASLAAAASACA